MIKVKGTSILRFFVAIVLAMVFSLAQSPIAKAADEEAKEVLDKTAVEDVVAQIEEIAKDDKELADAMKEELVQAAEKGDIVIDLENDKEDKSLVDLSTTEGRQKALEVIQADFESGKGGLSAEKLAVVKEAISGYTDEKSFEEKMKSIFEGEHQGEYRGEGMRKEGEFKEFMKSFEGKDQAEFTKEAVLEALEKSGAEGIEKLVGHELSDQEKADAELFRSGTETDRAALMEKYGREGQEYGSMDKEVMERMAREHGGDREMAERFAREGGFEREAFERGFDREGMEREARERGFDREGMEREARERNWEPPSELRDPPSIPQEPPRDIPPPPGG